MQSLPEFLLDSAFAFPQGWLFRLEMRLAWETEKLFFVLLLFSASGLEMESATSSSVLVKSLATESAWIYWPAFSDVFGRESALVLL